MPLMGTHLDSGHLFQLVREYEHVVVWLDNDSETVRKHAENLVSTIQLLGKAKGYKVPVVNDPKQYSTEFIIDQLNSVLNGSTHRIFADTEEV